MRRRQPLPDTVCRVPAAERKGPAVKKTTTAALAVLALVGLAACSNGEGQSIADAAGIKVCAAVSGSHGGAQADPVARSLADAAARAGASFEAAEGADSVPALAAGDCSLVVATDSTLAAAVSDAARSTGDKHFALVGSAFTDSKGNPEKPSNGTVINVQASQGSYLAGYAAAGMTTTGTVAVVGGARDLVTLSQMDAFVQGVDAYNLATGTSIQVLGWSPVMQEGAFASDADGVRGFTETFIAQGADIVMPVADAANSGAAQAIAARDNPALRLVWTGLDKSDLKGLSREDAESGEDGQLPISGQSGAQAQRVDTSSFADAFSSIQLDDEARAAIGAPVLTSVVVDYSGAFDALIASAAGGATAPMQYVSLISGGVILTGFGSYTPMLSTELKLGLSDMAGQIETGGLAVTTQYDVVGL